MNHPFELKIADLRAIDFDLVDLDETTATKVVGGFKTVSTHVYPEGGGPIVTKALHESGGPITLALHESGGPIVTKALHESGGPITLALHESGGPITQSLHETGGSVALE
jgi:hypothetical protein